jgi:para-aminobenzoate synthetase component I
MRVVPLALRRAPADVLATIAEEPGAFLLDVPDPQHPATLIGCAPHATLVIRADGTVASRGAGSLPREPLAAVERFVDEAASVTALPFPLGGGVVGYLGYELGRLLVPHAGPAPDSALPLAAFARYDPIVVFDHRRAQYTLVCSDGASSRAPWLERLTSPVPIWSGALAREPLAPVWPRVRYLAAVDRVREYLVAGDAYQVNLTQPFAAPLDAPAWALLRAFGRRHPTPYGAYLDLGGTQLVANSPELFLRRRGMRVETRPIKGTRPRGEDPARDAALAAELLRDEKERAEHVMIVDLERNDLGRVAATGSVAVEAFVRLESHPSLHHLVSVVRANLPSEVGLAALLAATFPGGSITGAPKRRAMEIIGELEPWARGPYTGAIGLFHPEGDLELGLAIRTAVIGAGAVRYHAGGGIVVDSDPERELAEAWLKTAAIRLALGEDADAGRARCSSG